MEDCKETATPIATNCLMDTDEARNQVDSKQYRGLIGSLLYLNASRPDIQFGVCLLGFNPIQRNHTSKLQNGFSSI